MLDTLDTMTSHQTTQTMKPATAAKKLGVYLEATPAEFQEGVVSRTELNALQADPPEWLQELRRNGPHPRPVVAAKLGVSISGLARGGVTEAAHHGADRRPEAGEPRVAAEGARHPGRGPQGSGAHQGEERGPGRADRLTALLTCRPRRLRTTDCRAAPAHRRPLMDAVAGLRPTGRGPATASFACRPAHPFPADLARTGLGAGLRRRGRPSPRRRWPRRPVAWWRRRGACPAGTSFRPAGGCRR